MQRQNLCTALRTFLGCVLLRGTSASAQPPHTPPLTHGVSTGDVTSTSAAIWARTDRNAHGTLRTAPQPSALQAVTFA